MRFTVCFKTDTFPVLYSALGISIIKEALKKEDENYYKELYEGKKASKNFTFSFYVKDYVKEGDMFVKNDGVYMTISTPDVRFGLTLYNGLNKMGVMRYKHYVLNRGFIKIDKEMNIADTSVIIKTLSPIIISKDTSGYLMVGEEGFNERLNYVMDIVLKNYRGYGLTEPIELVPLKVNKVVVKQDLRGFKEETNKAYNCIDANKGTFILKGSREDLNLICQIGIGFRRGQGFGNVKIV